MNIADLIAIDTHTDLEVSCRNPFDNYGEEYDRAADKYFRSSKRPTMQETIDFYREQTSGSTSRAGAPNTFRRSSSSTPTRCSGTASCSAVTSRSSRPTAG